MAAIGACHKLYQEDSLGKHKELQTFMKGVFKSRPPVKEIVPQWELGLVMQALVEAPFEPAGDASLKFWTWKTAFLLAITSAARVSELQALDSNPNLCRVSRHGADLRLNPAFCPKSCNVNYLNRQIHLQSFYPEPKDNIQRGLHKLCPVRALRYYISKTSNIRVDSQLLLSYQPGAGLGHKINKATVARWIRQTVCLAYEKAGRPVPQRVRAHQTRALAASLADLRGVSPADLCAAATWSSANVFAKFYRLDLAASERGISTQVLKAAMAVV